MAESVTYNKHASPLIFSVGVACMIVAGYFLIEGLSQFSGNATTRNILIIGGILFQITESLCFIAAAALAFHSRLWRVSLFMLGCVLFLFSVAVMTLAQKTALQAGVNEAGAIDEKRQYMREQMTSLDRMIESYQYNAEKQSKSIYKDSRALGQDSINRATAIEQQKLELSDELFALNQERKETSVDFFNRLEEVTGLPSRNTEFYFLVLRSLLIELSGILLMAFGASLRTLRAQGAYQNLAAVDTASELNNYAEPVAEDHSVATGVMASAEGLACPLPLPTVSNAPVKNSSHGKNGSAVRKKKTPIGINKITLMSRPRENEDDIGEFDLDGVDLDAEIQYIEDHPKVLKFNEHSYSLHIQRLRKNIQPTANNPNVKSLGNSIIDLYQKGVIASLNREEIINGLRKYHNVDVDKDQAIQISDYISRENETVES
ncbi:MAG: hypothetical protein ACC707_11405 [Thiohalomonadales bacterium]